MTVHSFGSTDNKSPIQKRDGAEARGATLVDAECRAHSIVRARRHATRRYAAPCNGGDPMPPTCRNPAFGTWLTDPFRTRFTPASHLARLAVIRVAVLLVLVNASALLLKSPTRLGREMSRYRGTLEMRRLSSKGERMNFDTGQKQFLERLLTTPPPSGHEAAAGKVWRDEASTFASIVDHDLAGNSWASNREDGGLHVMIEGHIDEIGFVVTWIDDDGFIWIDRIGGWDEQVVVGQRMLIAGREGLVHGVIGKKAAHLLKESDRSKPTQLAELWIDIGAKDKADAERRVEIGDPAVIDVQPLQLTDDLLVSRSIDNRIGSFVALEVLRKIGNHSPHRVTALVASQEEIGLIARSTPRTVSSQTSSSCWM